MPAVATGRLLLSKLRLADRGEGGRYDRAKWEVDPETEEIIIHPEKTTNEIGLVAQEVQKVMPEAVSIPEDENSVWALSYSTIIPVLVKAIQEQQAQIEALKQDKQALATSVTSTDTPLTADFDGDDRTDRSLVSASGDWYFWLSGSGFVKIGPYNFGITGKPVAADFDNDGKADPGVVSASGTWYFWLSADGYSPVSAPFAISGATPVAADFDADGRADPVMVTSAGGWYLWPSSQMYTQHGPYNFGVSGKPVAGDFDGDGKADPAMVDSSGNWNLFLSSSFYLRNGPWYLVLP